MEFLVKNYFYITDYKGNIKGLTKVGKYTILEGKLESEGDNGRFAQDGLFQVEPRNVGMAAEIGWWGPAKSQPCDPVSVGEILS